MEKQWLIADSGSTKTDWCLASAKGIDCRFETLGMNPFHQTDESLCQTVSDGVLPKLGTPPDSLAFYGSGCTPAQTGRMTSLLKRFFPTATVEVQSDLLGAARALCGHEPGVACILGTGSNSGLYDGRTIVQNTPALGYILGDEGGGAALGRDFVADLYKGILPASLKEAFENETGQTQSLVIENVYRRPMANRYLASFTRFIGAHREVPGVREFLVARFRRFFSRNVRAYGRHDLPVHFIGSIAAVFCDELAEAARQEGFTMGTVSRSPMDGLLKYHTLL